MRHDAWKRMKRNREAHITVLIKRVLRVIEWEAMKNRMKSMNAHSSANVIQASPKSRRPGSSCSDGASLDWHGAWIKPCDCCPDCNEIITMQEQEIDNLRREVAQLKARLKVRA